MTPRVLSRSLLCSGSIVAITLLSSCSVDQDAAFVVGASQSGSANKKSSDQETNSWKEAQEKRKAEAEKRREELAKKKAADDAAKEKELAVQKRAKEKAAAEKEKQLEIAKAEKEAAKKKADELAAKRKAERQKQREVAASAEIGGSSSGGGLFGGFGGGGMSSPAKYKSQGHYIKVNNRLLDSLNASNAKIEISLSEQRARIYKTGGASGKVLVIETQVATGRSGYSTPTGSYRIQEKAVEKRSTLYGRWVNSSGATIRSDGESTYQPAGASQFIGASMPYWMRVTGGIGMHVGYVPNGPASHGCIRVPASIQPLIFSKVGVGTSVTISY